MSNHSSISTADIYDDLKDRILNNDLIANQPLRQDEIASKFGISKIPVREALRQLESDGLVKFIPRRGAFVVELTEADILENLEIRVALEIRALELAIPNMTALDITLAREILEEYQQVDDVERWSELNSRFHQSIYAACGMPKMMTMIQDLKDRTQAFMRLKITKVSGFERPHSEHMAILDACEKHDITTAVQLLKSHIKTTKKEVTAFFRRQALAAINMSDD
ncbi:MAG: GntR family transcriptional regulator [Gammaproteobacteria bacterium]|nr:MAG: GntR family transcriptional regulator [Gammaproteobacteria bacterium]